MLLDIFVTPLPRDLLGFSIQSCHKIYEKISEIAEQFWFTYHSVFR